MGNKYDITSSSLDAYNQRFEMITNNLANASTVGFKRRRDEFAQVMASQGNGSAISSQGSVDFSQGGFIQTGAPLNFAINGKGFFVVDTPQGQRYTRNGVFGTDAQGQLVDSSGRTVMGESGPIKLPATGNSASIEVSPAGDVIVGGTTAGRLKIVEFEKASALTPAGPGLYRASLSMEPQTVTNPSVRQGCLENSNVNIVEELVGLITVTRMYQANLKTVTTQDDQLKNLLQVAMG